ncbi:hypothetical protein NSK_003021 [Nannochloropsis salina CCMP1776]|uniref:Uncharacterized protein n=1 Tax=Nannochloropsis salina CCMP1776 TaxID=1027361 RepID=A0A4D9D1C5_9STRA|nr:hypothetical protein NSK_003021 [Nannochloropsis salina CCMP1776]|eukprot:TFJ85511.1 hypothetical protein NSK_003021 [Nannochloropsis salina CCMP1776]
MGRFLSSSRLVPVWKRELHLAAGVMVVWGLGVLARRLFRVLGTERQSGLQRKGPAEPGMLAAQVSHSPAGEEGGLGAKSRSQEWTLTPSTPAPPHPGRKARRKKGSGGGKRAAGGKAAPLGGLPGPGETAGAPGGGEGGRGMEEVVGSREGGAGTEEDVQAANGGARQEGSGSGEEVGRQEAGRDEDEGADAMGTAAAAAAEKPEEEAQTADTCPAEMDCTGAGAFLPSSSPSRSSTDPSPPVPPFLPPAAPLPAAMEIDPGTGKSQGESNGAVHRDGRGIFESRAPSAGKSHAGASGVARRAKGVLQPHRPRHPQHPSHHPHYPYHAQHLVRGSTGPLPPQGPFAAASLPPPSRRGQGVRGRSGEGGRGPGTFPFSASLVHAHSPRDPRQGQRPQARHSCRQPQPMPAADVRAGPLRPTLLPEAHHRLAGPYGATSSKSHTSALSSVPQAGATGGLSVSWSSVAAGGAFGRAGQQEGQRLLQPHAQRQQQPTATTHRGGSSTSKGLEWPQSGTVSALSSHSHRLGAPQPSRSPHGQAASPTPKHPVRPLTPPASSAPVASGAYTNGRGGGGRTSVAGTLSSLPSSSPPSPPFPPPRASPLAAAGAYSPRRGREGEPATSLGHGMPGDRESEAGSANTSPASFSSSSSTRSCLGPPPLYTFYLEDGPGMGPSLSPSPASTPAPPLRIPPPCLISPSTPSTTSSPFSASSPPSSASVTLASSLAYGFQDANGMGHALGSSSAPLSPVVWSKTPSLGSPDIARGVCEEQREGGREGGGGKDAQCANEALEMSMMSIANQISTSILDF